ncbi:10303_t:CDS:2 [Paraglomus brasilianum]|uniref:10303_t:CDS:1 n=1 Tax=Paraglomus brasilianum TaxID=144538 RepID=A0A9N9CXK2_9GLOM|nr:10303_t:CDS:2 [Paraglomus brasilianum]
MIGPDPIRALIGTVMVASKDAVGVMVALGFSQEARKVAGEAPCTILLCTQDNLVERIRAHRGPDHQAVSDRQLLLMTLVPDFSMHSPRLEDLLPMQKDLTTFKSLRGYGMHFSLPKMSLISSRSTKVTIFAPTNLAFLITNLQSKARKKTEIQPVDDAMRRLKISNKPDKDDVEF